MNTKTQQCARRSCNLFILIPLFFLLVVVWTKPIARADNPLSEIHVPSFATLLTDDLTTKKPLKKFSCTNRVYLYFTWYLLEGHHKINAFWINPQGKEENQVQLKFSAKGGETHNWVALEFKNIFDKINLLTPSLKAAKLTGKWKVRILLDGKLLETLDFAIHCG